jgi:hypothetical protein
MGLALVGALVGALATPAPADAAPDPSIDTAALLAVPAPACDIVLDPATVASAPVDLDQDAEIRIDGPIIGLAAWAEDLLSDPVRWGLTEFEYVHLTIAVHPRLLTYPLLDGPVVVANSTELLTVSRQLFGPSSGAFDTSSARIRPLEIKVQAAPAPNAEENFLKSLRDEGTFTADMAVSRTGLIDAFSEWDIPGAGWSFNENPFPRDLNVFIALRVGSLFDTSDQRGILMPCTLPSTPDERPAAPSPQLDVTCTSDVPRAGEPLACTLHGAPADAEFLWRASVNPTVAEGVITTGADGTGDFTIAVPADVVGQLLSVEIVAWTAPMPLGVVAGPVPTSVPAGLGQPAAPSGSGRGAWVSAAGLMALAGVAALRRAGT